MTQGKNAGYPHQLMPQNATKAQLDNISGSKPERLPEPGYNVQIDTPFHHSEPRSNTESPAERAQFNLSLSRYLLQKIDLRHTLGLRP
jgi:hypothetical protein